MRLVLLVSLLAFFVYAPGSSHASEPPSSPVVAKDGVPIGQVVDQVRCNVARAINFAAQGGFNLTIASVQLALNARRSADTQDEFALEIPLFEEEIGAEALSKVDTGEIARESDHKVVVRFVPNIDTPQRAQSACLGHLGFVETLEQLASPWWHLVKARSRRFKSSLKRTSS